MVRRRSFVHSAVRNRNSTAPMVAGRPTTMSSIMGRPRPSAQAEFPAPPHSTSRSICRRRSPPTRTHVNICIVVRTSGV